VTIIATLGDRLMSREPSQQRLYVQCTLKKLDFVVLHLFIEAIILHEVQMSLSSREITQLRQIITIAEKLLAKAEAPAPVKGGKASAKTAAKSSTGGRRTGKELVAFRKMLKAERKQGVPVADIAQKHGVSLSYIYQLG
jgi:hypothetical protein